MFFPQYSPLTQFVSGRKHQSVSLGWILGDNLSQVKCDKHLQACAPKIAKLVYKSNNSGWLVGCYIICFLKQQTSLGGTTATAAWFPSHTQSPMPSKSSSRSASLKKSKTLGRFFRLGTWIDRSGAFPSDIPQDELFIYNVKSYEHGWFLGTPIFGSFEICDIHSHVFFLWSNCGGEPFFLYSHISYICLHWGFL